jgi:hypothetical protein
MQQKLLGIATAIVFGGQRQQKLLQ